MTFYFTPRFREAWRRRMREMMEHDLPEWEQDTCEVFIPLDVIAEKDAYVISAWLPGVASEELDIQVINETVTIQGELKKDYADNVSFLMQERPCGRFQRTVRLPALLDPAKAEAQLKEGVLTLRVPKVEEAKPKTVKVKAG